MEVVVEAASTPPLRRGNTAPQQARSLQGILLLAALLDEKQRLNLRALIINIVRVFILGSLTGAAFAARYYLIVIASSIRKQGSFGPLLLQGTHDTSLSISQ